MFEITTTRNSGIEHPWSCSAVRRNTQSLNGGPKKKKKMIIEYLTLKNRTTFIIFFFISVRRTDIWKCLPNQSSSALNVIANDKISSPLMGNDFPFDDESFSFVSLEKKKADIYWTDKKRPKELSLFAGVDGFT